ncbi:MAG TPA: efflux RND transporter periplasmic adaptor subunit [Thiobacillus sp.]|nr:MAG: efflux transporter periplasmic adaptor subunit [Hydrogenophilales bacterium 16-64-40]OZA33360.1 MAG: efflux transporter periplasmic adaptor subunit [Hydrogenophilales bacterium 17-64-65]HQS81030.1 efflux RND transporter periplasmic adaptor subunit [Thiobacillus sp.]HQT33320.1 efflux RND transporter periplasmic adaptor subunit [Thiobacillus sp.]
MKPPSFKSLVGRLVAAVVLIALGAAGAMWWTQTQHPPAAAPDAKAAPADERRVLYWYDPMVPAQQFDKPGKSPFMDMELVPKYADEGGDAASVRIDASIAQNLGMRLAPVTRTDIADTLHATGLVRYNERDIAIVQARSGGYVERVARLAPGDVVKAGAFIGELLVPQWAAAQQEYLALKATGDAELTAAAEARMRLAGMPERLIREVKASGRVKDRIAITAPIGGELQSLDVRPGMTLSGGQTLARINGIASVWLDVAVPQAQAGQVRTGHTAEARFAAFPGETVTGRVIAILPGIDPAARALTVRIELPNHNGRIRPGLSAEVQIAGATAIALTVPSEAVIRSSRRALVIVAEDNGRYRPVEVTLGRQANERTEVLTGLAEGQQVVASGQFLIDSEASLQGVLDRLAAAPKSGAPASPLHEADAVIEDIDGEEATLAHGPFESLSMPGMTMVFPLARPELAQGLKTGDRVRVGVRQTDDGLLVEKLDKTGGAK